MHPLLIERLGLRLPIIQAPMAGTSTPEMAAAVSNAGGLGSIGIGAVSAETGRGMIRRTKALTTDCFNVNVFCHRPAQTHKDREEAWLQWLTPQFKQFGAMPPESLSEIYGSFVADDRMLAMLLEERPAVISFHFGFPSQEKIDALRSAGIILFATATSLSEGSQITAAGIDAIVAQGYEAGGHRGAFDPDAPDDRLTTAALVRLLVARSTTPIIAAGGIMDGAGIAAALSLGAIAAQLGTAFVGCPESAADAAFRAAMFSDAAYHTTMTRAISGRLARCLANEFTRLGSGPDPVPDYPLPYAAGKALNTAARAAGQTGFAPQWAGQGAPLAQAMPAGDLVRQLADELRQAAAT